MIDLEVESRCCSDRRVRHGNVVYNSLRAIEGGIVQNCDGGSGDG